MLFNIIMGTDKVSNKAFRINNRYAARAIILRNGSILMVRTNKGDLKFPGGGVKSEENHEDAIKREVKEETGYIISQVKERIGIFTERNIDKFDEGSIFEMISYYYLCEITKDQVPLQLDDYEEQLELCPQWVSIDEAIAINDTVLKSNSSDLNSWVFRETAVLNKLKAL